MALMNENNKVIALDLLQNNIGDDGVKYLSTALMNKNSKVTELTSWGNNFGDVGAHFLSNALMNENNNVTKLNLNDNNIGDAGVSTLSIALMNSNNKVTKLILSRNNIGDDGARVLSTALMDQNNKLTTLDHHFNNIGNDGAKSLSNALMNENSKLTTLGLLSNKIGTPGLVALFKSVRFSVVSQLKISEQAGLHPELQLPVDEVTCYFNEYLPRLACLASVRTIRRIGCNSHVRMLSSDILIRASQTLGWFIDLNETIVRLENHTSCTFFYCKFCSQSNLRTPQTCTKEMDADFIQEICRG